MRVKTRVKYWELVADNLKKAGWSWGCVSALDSQGRTMWIVDAQVHRRRPAAAELAAYLARMSLSACSISGDTDVP